MDQFSFKSFEDVRLKATYNIEVGGRSFQKGETVALFDKIQIAGLTDIIDRVTANGGFDNRAHVFWETTREERLTFSQGVFNRVELALLANSRLLSKTEGQCVMVTEREVCESDETGHFQLQKLPFDNIFVYNAATGERLTFTNEGADFTIEQSFLEVVVDYRYCYKNDADIFLLGSQYFNGYLELEGKTRVKDDTTGHVVTGLIHIPRLKLMSDLSIRLGKQANPVVANFTAVGVPVGSRGSTYVSEFYLLSDDISSDL